MRSSRVQSQGPRISLSRKRKLVGFLFTLPFIVGFVLFFAYPFGQTIVYSVSTLSIHRTGYDLTYAGLSNYNYVLRVDPNYVRAVANTMVRLLTDIPLILAFSLFAAMILNQKFKGRMLARVIFFLPVIYGAGIILKMEANSYMDQLLQSSQIGNVDTGFFSPESLERFFMDLKLPSWLLDYIIVAQNHFADIIKASGIQILIFLAGLQSISPSLYESAHVEGATGWESFWKVTFPMITPLIMTNTIYTIIQFFGAPSNQVQEIIGAITFQSAEGFGRSAAMTSVYVALILAVLAVVSAIVSRMVVYND